MAQLKQEIAAMIATIMRKRQLLDELLDSLRNTKEALDNMPDDLADMLINPAIHRTSEPSPSFLDEVEDQQKLSRLVELSHREDTQFAQICRHFVLTDNRPVTNMGLAETINTSKNSVANILYRTQREAFVSEKVPGHPRLRAWKLKPELYEMLKWKDA